MLAGATGRELPFPSFVFPSCPSEGPSGFPGGNGILSDAWPGVGTSEQQFYSSVKRERIVSDQRIKPPNCWEQLAWTFKENLKCVLNKLHLYVS